MGEVDDDRIEFVQFHQNYSYEDFMMGYKPVGEGFELKYGIFYRFCQKAANHPDKDYFFIIDEINRTQEKHIITLEDPLEFLHRHKKSIVSQREISSDTESYLTALRASLRQSPDVILLGEMRDFETISVAMTAAETGHLVLSTLHTLGAANTIDRIIDVFPPNQQRQISVQLSSVLHAVVSQQLVPSQDGKLVPAFELMTTTSAIRNMIRENKIHQSKD